jgi:hypothetical protein
LHVIWVRVWTLVHSFIHLKRWNCSH